MKDLIFLESTVKMPLMSLPVRSTLVPLTKGKVLISPGSKLQRKQLEAYGGVTDLVAPSLLHCAGIPQAAQVFPQAKIWGPQGSAKHKPEIQWSQELTEQNWPYQEELPMIEIFGAPVMTECVFFHRYTRTLILCDLAFNLNHSHGIGSWIITHLFGTYRQFAVSRLTMMAVKDKKAFTTSVEKVFALDFDNVVVSHGDVVRGNAKAKLREAFAQRGIRV